jgi:hypothetical protein
MVNSLWSLYHRVRRCYCLGSQGPPFSPSPAAADTVLPTKILIVLCIIWWETYYISPPPDKGCMFISIMPLTHCKRTRNLCLCRKVCESVPKHAGYQSSHPQNLSGYSLHLRLAAHYTVVTREGGAYSDTFNRKTSILPRFCQC